MDILWACLAMFARDGIYALLTVAESKGRAMLAGLLDAMGDLAGIAVTVFSAGEVITSGITTHVVILILALLVTSFCTTSLFTRLGRRMEPAGR